jgi:UDP-glucose 4-epimerase
MRRVQRALVLGGTGFIGRHLVARLSQLGIEATAVGRRPSRDVPGASRVVHGDVLSLDLRALMLEERPEVLFHLANAGTVPPSLTAPAEDLEANVATTLAALEAMRRVAEPPLMVFVSSAAVYGTAERVPMGEDHPVRPASPYGVSKFAAEQYVRLYADVYGLATLTARPFSVYGPGQRKLAVHDLLRRLLDGEDPLRVAGSPDVSRDFVWVGDAAGALVQLALAAPAQGEAYNVASGRETTLRELVANLIEIAAPHTTAQFSGQVRVGDPLRWAGDASRAAALGASCDTPLADGLRLTAEWLLAESVA